MGDIMGDKEYDNETLHPVTVGTFYLSPYEVTFEEYDRYCGRREKPSDQGWGRAADQKRYDREYDWRSRQAN
ncbi:MAG: hypothetical protein IPN33_26675 [Saprospiraceae bacterium]|nr:hypothetical protein [Saprospiraceae bacterium]